MDMHVPQRTQPSLITPSYRAMQAELHESRPDYGVASTAFAPLVSRVVKQLGVRELLDYGAGKGRLGQALAGEHGEGLVVHHYDPAIEAWSADPEPREMVACIDVLEHIEPECLDPVLDDLHRVTRRVGFFTIHTGPAAKVLSDGRNAHLIQQPSRWWLDRIAKRFSVIHLSEYEHGFCVIVAPLPAT